MQTSTAPENDTSIDELLVRLARSCRILAMEGHDDLTLGHLSVRDPEGRGLWLKKPRRGLEEVVGPNDFGLIDFDGKRLINGDGCHAEWPIHTEIMRARPDVTCVGHTHPTNAILFSATEVELAALGHEGSNYAGNLPRFREVAGLISTQALGRSLAQTLGSAQVVLMKNHGVTYVGHSIEEATLHGVFIEAACRMQLQLMASGAAWSAPDPAEDYNRKLDPAGHGRSPYIANFYEFLDRKLTRNERRSS
jgi:ribulose-5-phosphate 4-epimerase/fuculose-1-phosphate aldolase